MQRFKVPYTGIGNICISKETLCASYVTETVKPIPSLLLHALWLKKPIDGEKDIFSS